MNEFRNRMKVLAESSLLSGNVIKLSSCIAKGDVYKIPIINPLETLGFEYALLYLKEKSEIIRHQHINDIEQYRFIDGDAIDYGICLINGYHNIDGVKCDTIVESIKISKYLINNYQIYCVEDLNKYLVAILREKEAKIYDLLNSSYEILEENNNKKIHVKKCHI